jgi:DNA-binding transcriptional LysR family regulator
MALASRVSDLAGFDLLLSVARTGSIGQAAAEHRISQPSASARLAHLESRVGVALLERSPRGSRLTPDGALVADWARVAIAAADALEAGISALVRRQQARLRVVASMTVAEYALPSWLVAFDATAGPSGGPTTTVALSAGNSAEVADAVLSGRADLGFIEGPTVANGLTSREVGRDELRVVVAPSHPWARRRRGVDVADLAKTPMISREEGSGTRAAWEAALRRVGTETLARPLVELSSTTAIKSAVSGGLAPAVLSSLAVTADLAAGTLVAVPTPSLDLARRLRAVWPDGRRLTGPARDLLAIAIRRPAH